MDYQLHIYPSSEGEMKNIRTDNKTKHIKVVQENKLPALYKKSFGAAVAKHDERAVSGKLIIDYYKAIVESNIPEVYKLSLIVRYELLNKTDLAAINKAFADYKKVLEKESYLCVVSTYIMSFDEYKELQIFFYPISDGYQTGLVTRNDLIDVTKKICDIQDHTMNIIKAMPLFVKHMETLFKSIGEGQFISQEELEAKARNLHEENPMQLHAIAVETLKAQMNGLQKINAENQQLEAAVAAEKARIQHDIQWSKQAIIDIYEAERERIAEEKRLAEEARNAEEARKAAEAQRREEERLREEERRIEAARLAEQARRNIELRKQLAQQEEMQQQKRNNRTSIDQVDFGNLIEAHMQWQDSYGIDENAEYDQIPEHVLKDPRRLNLSTADIRDVAFDRSISLVGATFVDCEFISCQLSVELTASSIDNCIFTNSDLSDVYIKKCILHNVKMDGIDLNNIQLDDSTIMKVHLKNASISELFSAPGTSYVRCNFSNTTLRSCDMKKNAFARCNFTDASFVACDMRDSVFQVCKTDGMTKEGSLFRGVKFDSAN